MRCTVDSLAWFSCGLTLKFCVGFGRESANLYFLHLIEATLPTCNYSRANNFVLLILISLFRDI